MAREPSMGSFIFLTTIHVSYGVPITTIKPKRE
jgi:hypothetical protein